MKVNCRRQRDSILTSSIPWDSSWPRLLEESEARKILGPVEERFGISREVFKDFSWFRREKTWWMVRTSLFLEKAGALKISFVGLRAFTQIGRFIKPSTRMIQAFGKNATQSRLEIGKEDLLRLLNGEILHIEAGQEDGYVILSYHGDILGLGLLLNQSVRSQLPRHYKEHLDPFFQAVP